MQQNRESSQVAHALIVKFHARVAGEPERVREAISNTGSCLLFAFRLYSFYRSIIFAVTQSKLGSCARRLFNRIRDELEVKLDSESSPLSSAANGWTITSMYVRACSCWGVPFYSDRIYQRSALHGRRLNVRLVRNEVVVA